MPELTPLSPILDDFLTGQCISNHHGVRCYPAIHKQTEEKYILKVISIPASDAQLDVLLMTGALRDQEEAFAYFTSLAQDVEKEAAILKELSLLEGFLPCQQVQSTVTEDGSGYQIYLLSPYRKSVEAMFRHGSMTHLGAVNLGLDICAALAACRRAGYLYIDLKPENIYLDEKRGYCISDLGFISLSGLKYASLPDKYRNVYTAPEMADAMAELNTTLDVYALGLVLYQAYNGGTLPFDLSNSQPLTIPPLYADYEMAEIILRACSADPAARWQDPAQMGQALVGYMQRNPINDVPIVPETASPDEAAEETPDEFLPDMTEAELSAALAAEEDAPKTEAIADGQEPALPEEDWSALDEDFLSEDAEAMLAQADELMALVPPEPVIAPDAIEIAMPEPIHPILENNWYLEEKEEAPEETPAEAPSEFEPMTPQMEPAKPEPEKKEAAVAPAPVKVKEKKQKKTKHARPKKKRHIGRWIAVILALVMIGFIGYAGYYYYSYEYLQTVDNITVEGTDSAITVQIDSQIEDVLLQAVCTDSYGNTYRSDVMNGTAYFGNLNPQTHYVVKLTISGFHQLVGHTSETFTTASQTKILSFNAVIGKADGSVILDFTASGPQPDQWEIFYGTEDEPQKSVTFSGNTVSISGLTVGKKYTFELKCPEDLYLAGYNQLSYTASKIIYAENLSITECRDGFLTVQWNAPAGADVSFWNVHCYNASGYDETVIISETSYQFRNLTHDTPCTVEVTAVGMTKSVSTSICANPITVWGYPYTAENGAIQLSWNFTGKPPKDGWKIQWSVNGAQQEALVSGEPSVEIPVYIPGGKYEFQLETADGTRVFSNTFQLLLPEASLFNDGWLTATELIIDTCVAPDTEELWTWKDLQNEHFRSEFTADQQAYLFITTDGTVADTDKEIAVSYVISRPDGSLVHFHCESVSWNAIWLDKGCVLPLPSLPNEIGDYVLTIYFNDAYIGRLTISIF